MCLWNVPRLELSKTLSLGDGGGALEGGTLLLGNDKNNIVADKDQVVFRV